MQWKCANLKTIIKWKTPFDDSTTMELWCGCDNSFIEIFICDGSLQLKSKFLLKTHISSPDIPQDASIVQLKLSFNTPAAHVMYALHSCGHVISCWSVCEQPKLNTVIKLTQLTSPGSHSYQNNTLLILFSYIPAITKQFIYHIHIAQNSNEEISKCNYSYVKLLRYTVYIARGKHLWVGGDLRKS